MRAYTLTEALCILALPPASRDWVGDEEFRADGYRREKASWVVHAVVAPLEQEDRVARAKLKMENAQRMWQQECKEAADYYKRTGTL